MRTSRISFIWFLLVLSAAAETPAPPRRGAPEYAIACVACHQIDGKGIPGVYPPLAGSDWVPGSERRLAAILLYGLTGPVTVKGAVYPGLPMPAFREGSAFNWSDAKIADALTYIRSEWDNKAPPIETAIVSQLRKVFGERAEMTEAELKELK